MLDSTAQPPLLASLARLRRPVALARVVAAAPRHGGAGVTTPVQLHHVTVVPSPMPSVKSLAFVQFVTPLLLPTQPLFLWGVQAGNGRVTQAHTVAQSHALVAQPMALSQALL